MKKIIYRILYSLFSTLMVWMVAVNAKTTENLAIKIPAYLLLIAITFMHYWEKYEQQ